MLIDKVTLEELIELNKTLKPLDTEYEKVVADEALSTTRRSILLTNIFVKKAVITFKEFGEKSTPQGNPDSVDFLILWYSSFLEEFDVVFGGKWWVGVGLSEPILNHMSPVVFGQFIDAKMLVDAGIREKADKWQTVQYLIAIFCTDKYEDTFTFEGSDQFILAGWQSLRVAITVSKWWDLFNKYISEHYAVFVDSGDYREFTDNVDEYMNRWGWVNFLMNLAKTKAFDINGAGLNSIDCVRKTKASEVLIWASAEKEYNVATSRDTKEMYRNR